jgi:hypothetical protein
MNIISFDIGTKNFAYTVLTSENESYFKLIELDGRMKNIDSVVIETCQILTKIVKETISLFSECPLKIVIVREVRRDTVAINSMYSRITITLNYTNNILSFVANQKFIFVKDSYSAVKRAQKTLSIQLTRDLLSKHYPDKLSKFNHFKMKDDIADSFLMAYLSSLKSNG